MSTSKQVVEKAFDCFNKGDIEGITALCTEDTRWEVVGNAPWCGVHTGKQAVANDFFGKLATYLEATGLEVPHIIESAVGDWVSCPDMMYKANVVSNSGQDKGIEVPMCIIWQLKAGKVSKYWNYCSVDVVVDALKKAGRM
ncbi:hypothetical protein ABBQ38_002808 [Trebouxia sp. C0009 RCD-2024]